MNGLVKVLGGAAALIAAALVGGTLIGSVIAAPASSSSSGADAFSLGDESTDTAAYCQVFLDTFASELGVSTDDLAPAAKAAAAAAVDAAVDAGDLTQEQGDALKERIDNWDGTGCAWIGFHLGRWAHHGLKVDFLQGMFEAAAGELNMTTAELREALADSTLEEVAQAQGVSYANVTRAALASAKSDLDAAVSAGQITQDRADAIYDRLESWLNDGGPGGWGGGGGGHHGGFRLFFPPSDSGTDSSSDSGTEGTSA